MHTIAYIACSLDGYIAGKDGSLDWLHCVPPSEVDYYDFDRLQQDIDCVLMGRKTFETVMQFDAWPYQKMVYVLSSTLKQLESRYANRSQLVNGPIRSVLDTLGDLGNTRIYVDGGQVIQSCIRENLLDELVITTIATILGSGLRLFEAFDMPTNWEIDTVTRLNSRMVMTRYRRS